MQEVAAGPYKNYLRMRTVHQSDSMKRMDSWRMIGIFSVIKMLLWLLGVKKEFIGLTIYLEAVGTTNWHKPDLPDNNQFAMKLWFKDWP